MRRAGTVVFTMLSLGTCAACGGGGTDHDAAVDLSAIDAGDLDAITDLTAADAADLGTDAGPPAARFVFVGLGSGDLVTLDPISLAELSRTHTGSFPSFVAAAPDARHLYAVDESDDELVALSVSAAGATTVLNRQPCSGGPTHVSVDATGSFAFTASYGSGEVHVFPIAPDGTLAASVDVDLAGSHAHEAVPQPGSLLYVPCLGSDIVVIYTFDTTGMLTRRLMASTDVGAGPRHLAFAPDRHYAYLLDELQSEMDVYTVDIPTGALSRLQTTTTLPAGFTGTNAGAEVLVSADGRFVYATNRGDDSIAVFTRSATTGRLTLRENTPSGGMHPRSMALAQHDARLLVADRDSDVVVAFSVSTDGALAPQLTIPMAGMPYFVAEFDAPH